MNRNLIEEYAAGASVLAQSIAGLTASDLDAHPIAGTWSIREIVIHMMDSDLIGSERMKRIIAMDQAKLLAYDETGFAERLGYQQTRVDLACTIFQANRILTAELLHRLPEEAFQRVGHHSENGEMTLARVLQVYVDHLKHHMKFLHQKRELLGKPVK